MKGRFLLIGAIAATMLLGSGIGNAAVSCSGSTCTGSESTAVTIEPILTRSSLAVVRSDMSPAPNKIKNANIISYSLTASGGSIKATVKTLGNLITSTAGATNPSTGIAPYGGQHVMLMFQTNEFEDQAEKTGRNATNTADTTWGPNGFNADRFHWFLHFGWTLNKSAGDTAVGITCGMGIYDPTGALVSNTPTPVGQLFSVLGEDPNLTAGGTQNTTCSVSGNTITWTQPYRYTWATRDNVTEIPNRSKQIVNTGETIRNIKAFSWMDHEIGGPDPVGLILGWTWYTDSLPATAYQIGAIAGDPNPNTLWTPKCLGNEVPELAPVVGQGACTTANPVGSGFVLNGHNVTAA